LRELYRPVATKRELTNITILLVKKSAFVVILIYGDESWVMIERVQSKCKLQGWDFYKEFSV